MDWRWLAINFGVPVLGPVAAAFAIAGLWASGRNDFEVDPSVIVDVTPRALTFYNLALVSTTVGAFWPRMSAHAALGGTTLLIGGMVLVYHAFTVIWFHDPAFRPGATVYAVTLALTLLSVFLCHACHRRGRDD